MDEADVLKKIRELDKALPHFPDGRINYHNTSFAPVVNIFLKYRGDILIVKRSRKVGNYKGKWNSISGYLDRPEPIEPKALGEVEEETGITKDRVKRVIRGEPYNLFDNEIKKVWLVCPFIVELNIKPDIKLDSESTEYRWIEPAELKEFDTVYGLERSYAACIKI
jgi:8-oxo-dGTP pyrophosphatase MutT (NUDIX family)